MTTAEPMDDGRLAEHLDELVDIDPLKLRDKAHALLLRAQRAEAREGTLGATLDAATGRADAAEVEVEWLRADSAKLNALEAAGVDSWDGYSYAMEILNEEDDDA